MHSEELILKYFPHPEFREGQKETIIQIVRYFEEGYKNVCLEMPTGGGKSSIAFTISRLFGSAEFHLENDVPSYDEETGLKMGSIIEPITINHKSYIITPQKILQDQYGKDIDNLLLNEEMQVLKGKNNYNCLLSKGSKCDSCIMQTGKKCALREDCYYYKTEAWTIDAQTAVLNYHMLNVLDKKLYNKCYSEELCKIDKVKYERNYKRDLMIIDEAHNTESFLMNLISVSVNVSNDHDKLRYLSEPVELDEVKKMLNSYIDSLYKSLADIQNEISNAQNDTIAMKWGKKYNQVEQKIDKLNYLEQTIENKNWAFVKDIRIDEATKQKYVHAIECKPVFVSSFAQSMIFRASRLKLFISATLPEKEVFCKSLGLNLDDTVYITTGNNFPIENRKTYFISNKSKYHALNAKNSNLYGNSIYDDIIEIINKIINWEFHKNQKGLIITHTNKLMNDIINFCYYQRDFIPCSGSIEANEEDEIKDSRLIAINNHIKSVKPTILIGPNLYEGLDLKYDLARFVILVKCPYPFEDEQIKARRNVDYQWYYNNIGIKIIQGLGRGIRAKDDWVLNYLLDPGFDLFINGRGSKYIPAYIKQSLVQMPLMFFQGGNNS